MMNEANILNTKFSEPERIFHNRGTVSLIVFTKFSSEKIF